MITRILIVTMALASAAAHAGTAFFSHEESNGGMYKQCVYDYLGSRFVITVQAYKVCPVTIQV